MPNEWRKQPITLQKRSKLLWTLSVYEHSSLVSIRLSVCQDCFLSSLPNAPVNLFMSSYFGGSFLFRRRLIVHSCRAVMLRSLGLQQSTQDLKRFTQNTSTRHTKRVTTWAVVSSSISLQYLSFNCHWFSSAVCRHNTRVAHGNCFGNDSENVEPLHASYMTLLTAAMFLYLSALFSTMVFLNKFRLDVSQCLFEYISTESGLSDFHHRQRSDRGSPHRPNSNLVQHGKKHSEWHDCETLRPNGFSIKASIFTLGRNSFSITGCANSTAPFLENQVDTSNRFRRIHQLPLGQRLSIYLCVHCGS